jgi:RNA polymerase sigma-70 factor, ECF subfamily
MTTAASSFSEPAGSTSSGLLTRVQAHDPEAWRRLVHLYTPLVYHWCRQAGLQASDAADVLQEVFQAVARNITAFRRDRADDTFRGWLWTIARNKLYDHFRRMKKTPGAIGGSDAQAQFAALPEATSDGSYDAELRADGRRLIFRRALDLVRAEFEDRTWMAFYRTTVDAASPADVASELGVSVNAVYKAKSRVLARLREELADLFE